jgi:nucleotide-binding universal stress UspA family protein
MKVLVGIDESEYSGAAVRFIGDASWPEGTQFIVLSASSPALPGPGEVISGEHLTEFLRQEEERHSEIAERAAISLRKAGLSVEARTARANPQTALVEAAQAENVDLIIVGSHGRTGFRKLLLGSVASHVVTHAPCSVLVVKQPQIHGRSSEASARKPGFEKAMKVEQLVSGA